MRNFQEHLFHRPPPVAASGPESTWANIYTSTDGIVGNFGDGSGDCYFSAVDPKTWTLDMYVLQGNKTKGNKQKIGLISKYKKQMCPDVY